MLLTIKDTACLKGCSPHTIKGAIAADRLEAFKGKNGKWMVRLDDLKRWKLGERQREARVGAVGPETLLRDLPLDCNVYGHFRWLGVETVGELLRWSAADLLQTRNFGKGRLEKLKAVLGVYGLELSTESFLDEHRRVCTTTGWTWVPK